MTMLEVATATHRDMEVLTVEKIIFLHVHYLRQTNHRPSTIESRQRHLHRFFLWLQKNEFELIDNDVIQSFLDRHCVSANHRSSEIDHLKVFFRWAVLEQYITCDPTLRLVRPKRRRGIPRPIGDKDLMRALAVAQGDMKVWLSLAAYGGLRACEIAQLKGEDVDWQRKILFIREQKGGSAGSIPMNAVLEPLLETLPCKGWLFRKKDGTKISEAYLAKRANLFLHGIGIADTFHSLRHWFGTNCYRNSRDLRATQEAMRHNSPESTQVYTKIEFDEVRSVVDSLPELGAA